MNNMIMKDGFELTMETAKKDFATALEVCFDNIRKVVDLYQDYFENHTDEAEEIKEWFSAEVEDFKESCLCAMGDDPDMINYSEFTEGVQEAMEKRLHELYDQYVAEGHDPEEVKRFILEQCAPQMVDDFKTRFLEA